MVDASKPTPRQIRRVNGTGPRGGPALGFDISPDQPFLYVAYQTDGAFPNSGVAVYSLKRPRRPVRAGNIKLKDACSVAVNANGRRLLVSRGRLEQSVELIDVSKPRRPKRLGRRIPIGGEGCRVAASPTDPKAGYVAGIYDSEIARMDLAKRRATRSRTFPAEMGPASLDTTSDGRQVVTTMIADFSSDLPNLYFLRPGSLANAAQPWGGWTRYQSPGLIASAPKRGVAPGSLWQVCTLEDAEGNLDTVLITWASR